MSQGGDKKNEPMLCWAGFIAGDDSAFAALYELLAPNLFSFGSRFTDDGELVKDCVQEVFVRLYRNRRKLAGIQNIRSYVQTAFRNSLISEFRKRKLYRHYIQSYLAEEQYGSLEDGDTDGPDHGIGGGIPAVFKSLLTARQMEIMHYRFVEGMSIEEIAVLLDINYQSVANTIQRFLKKIRKFYLQAEYKSNDGAS